MKATAKIGDAQRETAIWFDTKSNTCLMPIKSAIRKKENVVPGEEVKITVWL